MVAHHFELFVAADAEVGGAHADDGAVADVAEAFDDQTRSCHLGQPIVVAALRPVLRVVFVGEREDGNFVSAPVQILNRRIIGVFVRNEVGAPNLAAVRVDALPVEDVFVQIDVVYVYSSVEGNGDHLGHVRWFQTAWNAGSVRGAEAVG